MSMSNRRVHMKGSRTYIVFAGVDITHVFKRRLDESLAMAGYDVVERDNVCVRSLLDTSPEGGDALIRLRMKGSKD